MYIGSCIDDKTNIACFAVFAREKKWLALGPTTEFSDRLLSEGFM